MQNIWTFSTIFFKSGWTTKMVLRSIRRDDCNSPFNCEKPKKKINFAIIPLDTFRFFCFFKYTDRVILLTNSLQQKPNKKPLKKKDDPIFWIGNEMISFPKDLFHLEWVILSWRCTRLFHSPRNRINEKSHD